MSSKDFSELEIDAIGEILNISLGASATAISTMLSSRVDITTPVVSIVTENEFEFTDLEPAVAVEITYVSGLSGSNIMLLKRQDVKAIVEMLMGMEIPDEAFELDEMNVSAICEVMNQMMGASSTALSEFLNKPVNISTPVSFEIKNEKEFRSKYFETEDTEMVVVGFSLSILGKLQSEFINLMSPELAKALVAGFLPDLQEPEVIVKTQEPKMEQEIQEQTGSRMLSQEEIEEMLAASAGEPAPAAEPAPKKEMVQEAQPETIVSPRLDTQPMNPAVMPSDVISATVMQNQMMMQQMMQQMQQMMQQMQQPVMQPAAEPKTISVHAVPQPNIYQDSVTGGESKENMDLILGVPLDISVEIGRTKKLVKDILEFSKGSLVVLDKVAGEQVDLFVNGQCIAKGDVVVVEDNFGIRITEIVKKDIMIE